MVKEKERIQRIRREESERERQALEEKFRRQLEEKRAREATEAEERELASLTIQEEASDIGVMDELDLLLDGPVDPWASQPASQWWWRQGVNQSKQSNQSSLNFLTESQSGKRVRKLATF